LYRKTAYPHYLDFKRLSRRTNKPFEIDSASQSSDMLGPSPPALLALALLLCGRLAEGILLDNPMPAEDPLMRHIPNYHFRMLNDHERNQVRKAQYN
jgi:hypothetical protein